MTSTPDYFPLGGAQIFGNRRIFNSDTAPLGTLFSGDLWWNNASQQWLQWDGSAWVVVGGGGAALPVATQADEMLVSTGPGVTWTPNTADSGRY